MSAVDGLSAQDQVEYMKLNNAKLKPRHGFTENLYDSESLVDSKFLEFNGKARANIFGADQQVYPDSLTTCFKMLSLMNEKQLLDLNEKLCAKFEHELV